MKTRTGKLMIPFLLLAGIMIFWACSKERSGSTTIPPGKSQLSLFITDGPYDFQQVLVDIQSVQVLVDTCHHYGDPDDNEQGDDNGQGDDHHTAGSCRVWSDLDIHAGVYDLLQLRNGNDTLLGSSFVPNGKIVKIKITLGSDNHIMADSVMHPLQIANGSSTFTIQVRNEHLDSIAPGNFHLLMDFNLARSIAFLNGTYYLRPACRFFSEHHTGSIEGRLGPRGGFGLVRAANATDTAYALPEFFEGEFKIRGLKAGSYDVLVDGLGSYKDTTITNVTVTNGNETDIGTVTLHQ